MNMFWRRYEGDSYPFSSDTILANHKFTNVYRSTDRVSQYLIRNVIYNPSNKCLDGEDILLQILIFKIFNKIETWEYILKEFGSITVRTYAPSKISTLLSSRIKEEPIFSPAYMMTGSHRDYAHLNSKHEKWLNMVYKEFIVASKFKKIIAAKSLEEVYNILNECAFLGGFLSYQYAIDFNYSEVIDFDENSFVKAGIGAIRGIKKCFTNFGKRDFEKAIRYTHENLEKFQDRFGYRDFKSLFGRNPTLIDLQNCFCETDKYLRVKLPKLKVDNVRIKQKFKESKGNYPLFFPPKWGILIENDKYKQPCSPQSTQGLTLY
jgi:hypothetical protein